MPLTHSSDGLSIPIYWYGKRVVMGNKGLPEEAEGQSTDLEKSGSHSHSGSVSSNHSRNLSDPKLGPMQPYPLPDDVKFPVTFPDPIKPKSDGRVLEKSGFYESRETLGKYDANGTMVEVVLAEDDDRVEGGAKKYTYGNNTRYI